MSVISIGDHLIALRMFDSDLSLFRDEQEQGLVFVFTGKQKALASFTVSLKSPLVAYGSREPLCRDAKH